MMNLFKRKANISEKRAMAPAAIDRRKVAIVGSGCAGMGAAWALKNSDYDVHIFEKSQDLGGHTNTQPWRHGDDEVTPVDTGFIVMNTETYPNFIRFLKEVGVDPVETEMTFGVSRDGGKFEWSGEPQGIFAQRKNMFSPKHYRMIFDIVRFNQFALDILSEDEFDEGGDGAEETKELVSPLQQAKRERDMSIGEYLDRHGYSQGFRDDYLIPMTAAVWSTSPDKASLDFPAQTLIRFMWNHHLLSTVAARPPWLTIPGGSRRYIDAIIQSYEFADKKLHLHTSCEVANIIRPAHKDDHGVTIAWIDAESRRIETDMFDHVILACHGDEILPLLAKHGANTTASPSPPSKKPTSKPKSTSTTSSSSGFTKSSSSGDQSVSLEETQILSSFQTTENTCYLHSDLSLMPTRRACWTSWNYLTTTHSSELSHPPTSAVSLTYSMNILQHIPETTVGPVLVTMNPPHVPDPEKTQGTFIYRHPLYTAESVAAQNRLHRIQNLRGVSYAGAWTKYGFHEDGFSSGLKVAMEHLGADIPFEFVDSTFSRGVRPELRAGDYLLRVVLAVLLILVRFLEGLLRVPGAGDVATAIGRVVEGVLDRAEGAGLL